MAEALPTIEDESDYWFIRTEGGKYFEEYVANNYIAIGWNYITLLDIENLGEDRIKSKIAEKSRLDPAITKQKSKISQIFNKIKRFSELKKGDFLVIPSRNSTRLAFAKVIDDGIYTEVDNLEVCPYFKRRKIEVLTTERMDSIDPKFYEIKSNRHSLSSINQFQDYVDRVAQTFYYKKEFGNLVFEVKQDEDIPLIPLLKLIEGIQDLLEDINEEFELKEELDNNIIKLNLQSKGLFAFKVPGGKSLALLGLSLTLHACNSSDKQALRNVNVVQADLDSFNKKKAAKIGKIDSLMKELKVDERRLYQKFK